jgi:hypothetical protein
MVSVASRTASAVQEDVIKAEAPHRAAQEDAAAVVARAEDYLKAVEDSAAASVGVLLRGWVAR